MTIEQHHEGDSSAEPIIQGDRTDRSLAEAVDAACRQHIVELPPLLQTPHESGTRPAIGAHVSHIAAVVLAQNARVIDCDHRGESFLRVGHALRLVAGRLCCAEAGTQPRFNSALRATSETGRTTNVLLHAPDPANRFSLTFSRIKPHASPGKDPDCPDALEILCLVAPLDRRRIATAQQLMDLFGLSAAEARLARPLCHGNSVEEYAENQGLRLPTVRTQLRSAFRKTCTERRAQLVRLIAGIPAVRDAHYSQVINLDDTMRHFSQCDLWKIQDSHSAFKFPAYE